MTSNISFDLKGQSALITGASSGFGERFAEILSDAGAKVVLTGRRIDRLQSLKSRLDQKGATTFVVPLDVTSVDSIKSCVSASEQAAGPISILINNAGLNIQSSANALNETQYDTVMNTNVKGAFFMAQSVGTRMITHKIKGRIVNIASIGALKPLPGLVAYSMSKAAIGMMTKALAREWAKHHIAVNALCPGFIRTELNSDWFDSEGGQRQVEGFPRKRLGRVEDLDAALLMFCSDHARFMTGSLLTIDDGQVLS